MFRNRRTSRKPDEEFYAAFKQSFPEVGPGTTSADAASLQRSTSLSGTLTDAHIPQRHFGDLEDIKDNEATPKPLQDTWRFTPSLMDPNSFTFTNFANQPPGYYTPTPGGLNTLYHSQAGDLHTPGMGMNIATPLSLPHTANALHAQDATLDLQHFHPHLLQPHHFQQPFGQQPSYAPSHFLQHQDSGYEGIDNSPHKSPTNAHSGGMSAVVSAQSFLRPMDGSMPPPTFPFAEKYRYHVTLNAPTAMIKHAEEIPITYLNKGQAYTMTVIDTTPHPPTAAPIKYRTFVRISFEDEQQRSRPGACWQLWKEGRGTNEAHQRGGRLLAVEHVDPNQGGDDELRRPQIDVESASFDGFCVTWTPNHTTGASECSISVRFNFLSTDFSHSKGVKGIPVRLCAKTEMIMPSRSESPLAGGSEVCFSKVKLFRDHGAERKLSNDVAHVKKTIDKLKQQISQAESGMGNFGKRKRSSSIVKAPGGRPGKVLKHKRTWSMDSDGENTGKLSAEEDLHVKLATMQDMFSSTRPVSVLYLRGADEDDPDLFPVQMLGESQDFKLIARLETWESKPSGASTPITSNIVSPTPSSVSTTSRGRIPSLPQLDVSVNPTRKESYDWGQPRPFVPTSPEQAVKVATCENGGTKAGFINAIDVDSTYQPPPERPIKPVACFYVRAKNGASEYYRAVYLMRRSVTDLVKGISEKFDVESTRIFRVTHVNSRGLHIVVDEDVVRELPEGQDMIVEFTPIHFDTLVKPGFTLPATAGIMVDSEIAEAGTSTADGLEMWLNF